MGRFESDLPFELSVLGQIDRPHRAFAESPNDPVAAELAGKPRLLRFGGLLRARFRHEGFLAVFGKRFGRVVRTVERVAGSSQLS